jgi:hypothetical protein
MTTLFRPFRRHGVSRKSILPINHLIAAQAFCSLASLGAIYNRISARTAQATCQAAFGVVNDLKDAAGPAIGTGLFAFAPCVRLSSARHVAPSVFFEHSFGKIEQGQKDERLVNVLVAGAGDLCKRSLRCET